jgi:hypothetical protein
VSFLDDRSVHFMTRMLERSGIGSETSLPPADHYIPPVPQLGRRSRRGRASHLLGHRRAVRKDRREP